LVVGSLPVGLQVQMLPDGISHVQQPVLLVAKRSW